MLSVLTILSARLRRCQDTLVDVRTMCENSSEISDASAVRLNKKPAFVGFHRKLFWYLRSTANMH